MYWIWLDQHLCFADRQFFVRLSHFLRWGVLGCRGQALTLGFASTGARTAGAGRSACLQGNEV